MLKYYLRCCIKPLNKKGDETADCTLGVGTAAEKSERDSGEKLLAV